MSSVITSTYVIRLADMTRDRAAINATEEACGDDDQMGDLTLLEFSGDCPYRAIWVVENQQMPWVVGHAAFTAFSDTIVVNRLAVKPDFRRKGAGSLLLDEFVSIAVRCRSRLRIPVRESNMHAQLWLRARGVKCVEIREAGSYHLDEPTYWFEL